MKKLIELKRQQLLTKSKQSDEYKDKSKGVTRYNRRVFSKISNRVSQYNKIDMNEFFKKDKLTFDVEVQGETSTYFVKLSFNGVLEELRNILNNSSKKERSLVRALTRSIINVFNREDVYVYCSCPDFKYRQAYFANKGQYASGPKEPRASNITNPQDTKGGGCKHVSLVLANTSWANKVASTINNYIKYAEKNLKRIYADYIFPKVYGIPYNKDVQLNLFDTGVIPSSSSIIDDSNRIGKDSGKFKPNNPYRFKPSNEPNKNQLSIDTK